MPSNYVPHPVPHPFERIASFVANVNQRGFVPRGAEEEFLWNTKRAYFAFGCDEEIKRLVYDIYNKAVLLQTLQAKQNGLSPGNDLNQNVNKQSEVLAWFKDTMSSLEQRFKKYLQLAH